MRTLRIAMAQMNPTVGDLIGNIHRIKTWLRDAKKAKADLVVFPELAITGYPPEDLLLKSQFVADSLRALNEITRAVRGLVAVVGYVGQEDQNDSPSSPSSIVSSHRQALFNAAAVIVDGKLVGSYKKWYLPNYGVFDESRYFHPGRRLPLFLINGTTIGVSICEDIWLPEGPTRVQAAAGAEVIVNINASPFHVGKSRLREQILATRARENGVIVTYTNMVGGQDELVFDGSSLILDQSGNVVARGHAFREELLVADLNVDAVSRGRVAHGRKAALTGKAVSAVDRLVANETAIKRRDLIRVVPGLAEPLDEIEEVYHALVLAVKDYVQKNGFTRAVIGLSGGIDSAVTAAIAVDALGAKHVLGVFMPSLYTSHESGEDVVELVRCLGIDLNTIPITPTFEAYRESLLPSFVGCSEDATEENLQARIRGNMLMAVSNKFGHLVLATGNKSEMSVGYSTLYGDMAGGFSVIKDVPKTMVYGLARFRNELGPPVIPKRILDRPPTAELKPNQKDEDSLPPYTILDPILRAYIEEDRSLDEIVETGFDRATVSRVVRMVDSSEFKRRQSPIGVKITHRAFGKDRRMPITNGYHIE